MKKSFKKQNIKKNKKNRIQKSKTKKGGGNVPEWFDHEFIPMYPESPKKVASEFIKYCKSFKTSGLPFEVLIANIDELWRIYNKMWEEESQYEFLQNLKNKNEEIFDWFMNTFFDKLIELSITDEFRKDIIELKDSSNNPPVQMQRTNSTNSVSINPSHEVPNNQSLSSFASRTQQNQGQEPDCWAFTIAKCIRGWEKIIYGHGHKATNTKEYVELSKDISRQVGLSAYGTGITSGFLPILDLFRTINLRVNAYTWNVLNIDNPILLTEILNNFRIPIYMEVFGAFPFGGNHAILAENIEQIDETRYRITYQNSHGIHGYTQPLEIAYHMGSFFKTHDGLPVGLYFIYPEQLVKNLNLIVALRKRIVKCFYSLGLIDYDKFMQYVLETPELEWNELNLKL